MTERITEVQELRHFLGESADALNFLVVTEFEIYAGGDAYAPFDRAFGKYAPEDAGGRLQVEGFALHPRHLEAVPVELVVEDAADALWLMSVIRESEAPLAERRGAALAAMQAARMAGGGIFTQIPVPAREAV